MLVILPDDDTFTILLFDDFHFTLPVPPLIDNLVVLFWYTVNFDFDIFGFDTRILVVALYPLVSAVIVTVPALIALTFP